MECFSMMPRASLPLHAVKQLAVSVLLVMAYPHAQTDCLQMPCCCAPILALEHLADSARLAWAAARSSAAATARSLAAEWVSAVAAAVFTVPSRLSKACLGCSQGALLCGSHGSLAGS